MDEEDFEALDAAVNGNRIGGPRIQQKDKGRKGKENSRQDKKDKKAQKNAQARNAARNEVRNELRNIEDETAQDKAILDKTAQEAAAAEKKADKKAKKAEAADAPKAKRTLYISVVPDEQAEVVITEDGLVTEYFVEMAHQVKIRGNIYKGVINNIDTNLQAAFVNFGSGKNGFLQIDEVHPEYYLVPHDASHGPKYPPIQKVLKVGQEVLVQVVKEPAGTKGAFLTTWISIAGRFLVLTPGQEQIGVSRKVEDPEERARLKELLNDIQPGENMGVIIRTASEGVNEASIQQDLQLLQKLWKDIQKKAPVEKTPSLIYQEADLATRSVRDYLSDDIEEIWTDDEATKARVEEIVSVIFPDRVHDLVKMHKDSRQTLWERFGLLKQLETVTSREVVLPSGGRLVFDQTEALMAIDINSGKTQGKTNFEAMVFRTNMEAAEAIARHLRLRDIGGQVVIDFIEMRDKSHCREVERTIRNAMRKDRARHDVGHMSSFGLLELVRQRTGTSAISITTEPCPHCHGTGVRRNMEWQALQAMRDMQAKLCKTLDNGKKKNEQKADKTEPVIFVYESDAELALYILNRKRDRIAALEEKYGVRIEVRLKG
ncbi:MAG: Rne/Rng family ribonuclease [Mailhella sp.]|nr:Rne/Rng family ribonuclease [Mailhella sp.]